MLFSSQLWHNVCLKCLRYVFQKLHQGKVLCCLFISIIDCLCVYHQHNSIQHHNFTRKSRRPEKESHDWYQKHECVPPILDMRIRPQTKRRTCRLSRDLYPLCYWRIASLCWSVTFGEIRRKWALLRLLNYFVSLEDWLVVAPF